MKTLKFLSHLENTWGDRVYLPTPLKMTTITKTVAPVDELDPHIGVEMFQQIILMTKTRMREDHTSDELQHHNRTATRMFAQEIFSEVADDLFLIMRHVHEHQHDPELANMVSALMEKLRP